MPILADIADLIRRQGDIAAAGERSRGDIWSQAINSIGQIASRVPEQVQQARMQKQEEAMRAQEMEQRGILIQQAKANQAATQQANQIISTLMMQNEDGSRTIDRAKAAQQMSQANIPPAMQATVFKSLDDVDASIKSFTQAKTDHMADLAHGAIQMIDGGLPAPLALATSGSLAVGNGLASQQDVDALTQHLATLPPEQLKAALQGVRGTSEKYKELSKPIILPRPGSKAIDASGRTIGEVPQAPPRPIDVPPGGTLVDPTTNQPVFTAPPKEDKPPTTGSFEDYVTKKYGANPTPAQIVQAHRELDKPPVVSVNVNDRNDVRDAVAGMKDGTIPPQLPGRASREYVALIAEARRQGFDLAKANEDWTATQKYLSTLNGAQQVRLRQAVSFTKDSLGLVEDLAKQWDGGKFPLLNKANLALAKQGALGPNAQSLATKLEAQISDLTSELGTVYKGGNSSTDESLKLAAKNLQADWSKKTLLDNVEQIRKNLQLRENSIRNGAPVANPGNPYTPQSDAQKPAPTLRYNPATGKVEPSKE